MADLPDFRSHGRDAKFVPLTPDDLVLNDADRRYLAFLAGVAGREGLQGARVLDLGCGRGQLVGKLRAAGVRAFGVEIDQRFLDSGRLVNALHDDAFPVLSLSRPEGTTLFPDGYFDLVISDQVLEHVAHLDGVIAEMARVLRPGGVMAHKFPARFTPIEPHYFLPLVHWLPKNALRRGAMTALLALGAGRRFFPGFALRDRVKIIYDYSVNETFYRSFAQIGAVFARHGLQADFRTGMQAHLRATPRVARNALLRGLGAPLGWALSRFKHVVLVARKPAGD